MARPEGYRKAVRLMEMADRFDIPVIALVDTAGAYPGIGAEERGQAEAIARSTEACLELGVPNVAVIIGEGGSGGAIAIATANRVLMLEHAIYSVISPEGAASILWRDTAKAQDAATNMKITAEDLLRFGVIDEIVTGAGRRRASRSGGGDCGDRRRRSASALATLSGMDRDAVRRQRREKFLAIGRTLVTWIFDAGLPFVHHIRARTQGEDWRCLVIASSLRITDTVVRACRDRFGTTGRGAWG